MIAREDYERYATALAELDELTYEQALAIIGQSEEQGGTVPASVVVLALQMLVRTRGDAAISLANDYYEAQATAQGAAYSRTYLTEANVDNVMACKVLADGSAQIWARGLATTVLQAADEQMMQLAREHHAYYALVPNPGACEWCCMIGSRGFDYCSEESVQASRHEGCRCAVVADSAASGQAGLAGYDPSALKASWDACMDSVTDGYGSIDYDRDAVLAEMATRNGEWLRTNKAPTATIASATASAEQAAAARALARCGFDAAVVDNAAGQAVLRLGTNRQWAVATASKASGQGIVEALSAVAGTDAKRVVVNCTATAEGTASGALSAVRAALDADAAAYSGIKEVLIVTGEGRTRRITR